EMADNPARHRHGDGGTDHRDASPQSNEVRIDDRAGGWRSNTSSAEGGRGRRRLVGRRLPGAAQRRAQPAGGAQSAGQGAVRRQEVWYRGRSIVGDLQPRGHIVNRSRTMPTLMIPVDETKLK